MGLKSSIASRPAPELIGDAFASKMATLIPRSASENKDARILYQGLTQAALQSMPMGQFAPDLATHLVNVKAAVEELAQFILEKSK